MIVDDPQTKAEVEAQFAAYERALVSNDVATLDRFFLASDAAIRYGAAENLYGYEAIKAFRAARPAAGLARRLEKTRIVTYGRDCAITADAVPTRQRAGQDRTANADLGPLSRGVANRRSPYQRH